MTQRDYGVIGSQLKGQYQYLNNFGNEIAQNGFSPGYLKFRSGLYVNSARQAYERGKTEAFGIPSLGTYPGSGNTLCGTSCKCHIRIRDRKDHWEVYWVRTALESCSDCINYAIQWNPRIIYKN